MTCLLLALLLGCASDMPPADPPPAEARLRFTRQDAGTAVGVVYRTPAGAVGTVSLGALAGRCAEEATPTDGLWALRCDDRAVLIRQDGARLVVDDPAAGQQTFALPQGLQLAAAPPAAPAQGDP